MGKFKPYDGEIACLDIERLPEFDCHCHILPGLDDGAKTIEDSLYHPVLAHPERYLWASQKDYEDMYEAGAAFQRNLGSVEGLYGDAPAERAKTILRWGLYTFLGTDTHDKRYTDFFDRLLGIPQGMDNEKED